MVSIEEALSQFYAEHTIKGSSPRTIAWYQRHLDPFLRMQNIETVEDWTPENLNAFLLEKTKTCTSGGLHMYYRVLRTLSSWLYNREYLEKNPVKKMARPKFETKKPEPFTVEQVQQLRTVARRTQNPLRADAIIVVLFDTGIRRGELVSMKLKDIDWQNYVMTVRGKVGERQVPFSRFAATVLRRYIDRERRAPPEEQHVFVVWSRPMDSEYVTRFLKQLCTRAGIKKKYTGPHSLRHAFAVEYLRGGGDQFHLKEVLGHTTLAMTSRYVSLTPTDLRNAHHRYSPAMRHLTGGKK